MKSLFGGFLAGLCIAIGCNVYLNNAIPLIGAVFFSVALLSICLLHLSLYTGKIGFLAANHSRKDIFDIIFCLIGNIIGTSLIALIPFEVHNENLLKLCNQKVEQELYMVLINAFLCGVLMYIAVYIYKEKKTIAGILFCVPTFIICGFEHVIADIYYFVAAKSINKDTLIFLSLVLIGNTLGSLAFASIHNFISDKPENT